jgi:DnaJ-class molecular chaperone
MTDYYRRLGVARDCIAEDIEAAYVMLAVESDALEGVLVELTDAYETLIDGAKRSAHDHALVSGAESGGISTPISSSSGSGSESRRQAWLRW